MKTKLDSLKNSLETINNLYAIKGGGGEDDDDFGNPRRPNRIPPRTLPEHSKDCKGCAKNIN
jgi:hypothetical protein